MKNQRLRKSFWEINFVRIKRSRRVVKSVKENLLKSRQRWRWKLEKIRILKKKKSIQEVQY